MSQDKQENFLFNWILVDSLGIIFEAAAEIVKVLLWKGPACITVVRAHQAKLRGWCVEHNRFRYFLLKLCGSIETWSLDLGWIQASWCMCIPPPIFPCFGWSSVTVRIYTPVLIPLSLTVFWLHPEWFLFFCCALLEKKNRYFSAVLCVICFASQQGNEIEEQGVLVMPRKKKRLSHLTKAKTQQNVSNIPFM